MSQPNNLPIQIANHSKHTKFEHYQSQGHVETRVVERLPKTRRRRLTWDGACPK
jgi:hypothetical protein